LAARAASCQSDHCPQLQTRFPIRFLRNTLILRWVVSFAAAAVIAGCSRPEAMPIHVGILHSMNGTLAISARPVVDATLLAIEEINAQGGLLGRPLEPFIADGGSDSDSFAAEAERLITQEKVSVVFGCWTSSSRKAVGPVFEKHNHLLFYPVQYEGLEQSPNIVYNGATPNQQVMPAVSYALANFGPRVFLVGSDYVFPRTANAIIRDQVAALGGEVVGEMYIPLGGNNVGPVVDAVMKAAPDVIFNTVNGDSNIPLFSALREAGVKPDRLPVVSFSISETELPHLGAGAMAGNYAAWNYFQSVDTPENRVFLEKFRARFGSDRVVSDPLEAAYFGVMLWAQAVRAAGSAEPAAVLAKIRGQGMRAPGGLAYIDGSTQHTWKYARIGRIRPDGQFDIVWSSDKPVRPMPFPLFRTRADWERWQKDLSASWGGRWVNPRTEDVPTP
jgi:urea transport system substrate-binding protein